MEGTGHRTEEQADRGGLLSALLNGSPIQTWLNHGQLQAEWCDLSPSDKATAGGPTSLSDLIFPQQWLG